MNLKVSLNQSLIVIKPSCDSQQYLQLNFGNIEITNKVDSSYDRCKSDEIDCIWTQFYNINMKEMQLSIVD